MNNKSQNHIIFSYSFNKDGQVSKLDNEQVAIELKNPNLSWVHLDGSNKNTKKWLLKEVNYLDSLIVDALIAEEARPRILKFKNGILLIFRGINQNHQAKSSDMVSVRMWIDDERIISIQKRPMKSIFTVEEEILNNSSVKNSGDFLNNILEETLKNISDYIYNIGDRIDEIEHEVFSSHNIKYRDKIAQTRSQLTIFKRYSLPQKELINNIITCEYNWLNEINKRYLIESHDKIIHIIEEIDEVLGRTKILHDELTHNLNEKINKNMFKLSMIAIIFMPLTFITSLFGMNFINIPWSNNPEGFYIICIVMFIITLIQAILFRKNNWL
jgi:zinc transporter